MRKWCVPRAIGAAVAGLGMFAVACSPGSSPRAGTQTNWLTSCDSDADCGDLQCLCGACTLVCSDDASCLGLSGAACVPAEDDGAVALCGGKVSASPAMCLQPCSAEGCGEGTSCQAGVCVPTGEPTVVVRLDPSRRYQTLVGIGAAIGYNLAEIVGHPRKDALFDAMFLESGFTALRLRNLYGQYDEPDIESSAEILTAATERLGQVPTVILNSASPPGALKRNGSNGCDGNPDTCTLASLDSGGFNYGGLAVHWRESLEAYALAGIEPDYISIQNNPDWVPDPGEPNEACRFLPTEGTATVATDSGEIDVEYPGYAEALDAVLGEISGLPSVPGIVAPETTGIAQVAEYMAALDATKVDAIAHHLYDTNAENLDLGALAALGELAKGYELPLFQSEMHAEPFTTALLMHAALAVEGAAVYVDNGFIASASATESDPGAIISLSEDDFAIGDNYHVMRHYSAHVGQGWARVAAYSDDDELLASAWASPEPGVVVVVLTNTGASERIVRLDSSLGVPNGTEVIRTVLPGIERSAPLGILSPEGVVTVPGQSIATVRIVNP